MSLAFIFAMKLIRPVVVLACWLLVGVAHAARLAEPYVVEVPVANQGQQERLQAEGAGLLLLLERLSGQSLDQHPAVVAATKRAEQYLSQFSYVQDKPVTGSNVPAAWRLRLVFLPAAVESLMSQAGIASWPLDRPRVLLLVANENAALLPAADGTDVTAPLVAIGNQRGIPLLVPDPAGQDLTVAAAVQGLDAASLQPRVQAAKADALMLGSVRGNDEKGWAGQWVVAASGQEQRFQAKGSSFAVLIDNALRQAAAVLSAGYRNSATADSGPATLRLQVDGVRSYTAFSRLSRYVEQLEAVRRVVSTQINGTTVIMDLDVKGKESFRSLANLSRSLQWQEEILPPPGSDPAIRPVWRYQWVD